MCKNFSAPPLPRVSRGRVKKGEKRVSDGYQINSHSKIKGRKRLFCTECGQAIALKSNLGIKEELDRISAYLLPDPDPSCPSPDCPNHGVSVLEHPEVYKLHGWTGEDTDIPRWRCPLCRRTFQKKKGSRKQLKSHENRLLFQLARQQEFHQGHVEDSRDQPEDRL